MGIHCFLPFNKKDGFYKQVYQYKMDGQYCRLRITIFIISKFSINVARISYKQKGENTLLVRVFYLVGSPLLILFPTLYEAKIIVKNIFKVFMECSSFLHPTEKKQP